MEKQKNIPVLRFPEFEGEWEKKKVKDLVEIKYGKDQKQIVCDNGKYPIMGTGGEMGRTNVFLYDKPSVMIGRKGTIDKPRFMDTPFWTVDTLFYTEVFDNTNAKWLYYKFETINWYLYNEASGVPSLSSSTIYSISIKTPTLPEQKKIATFFTAIDQKISQLKKKHQLLEQYKKGVMQKIFSQQIRFKDEDGREFPKWEKKRLGDIGENIIGLTYSPRDIVENGIIVLRSSNIKNNTLDLNDQVRVQTKIPQKLKIKKGDILICTRNGSQNLIGKNVCITDVSVPMTFGAFMSVFRSNMNDFLVHLFKTDLFNKQVQRNLGARINQITTGLLNKFYFDVPSLPEQTKIANFLLAIDDKAQYTQKQIEQAEQWKKGLMQKMFV